jgi:hypothetical protein
MSSFDTLHQIRELGHYDIASVPFHIGKTSLSLNLTINASALLSIKPPPASVSIAAHELLGRQFFHTKDFGGRDADPDPQ